MSFQPPRTAALTGLVLAGVLALSACSDDGRTSSAGGFVTADGGIDTVVQGGRQVPNALKGETLQGEQLDVADLKGKVVVMNVWGSWCPPCRAEAPNFVKVAAETKAQGVEFVGINTRDTNRRAAIAFENDYGIKYPSLYDPTGRILLRGFPKGSLNPQTIPSTIVLDRDGKIAARALQPLTEEKLRKMIDPLIAER
ncbi:TlpA family protein disulfide reductase [Streptomyces sp. NPDC058818]|uniref:TlpA family protein disulfide reductase n=1 Tax=Streptomyces sp. NPDC058818 TaxID=3346640 RepID=UPI0036B53826